MIHAGGHPWVLDFGLNPHQQLIVRMARSRLLPGSRRGQWKPPLWSIALVTLVLLAMVMSPVRYLALPLVPALGFWQRHRVDRRIDDWALDLRERGGR